MNKLFALLLFFVALEAAAAPAVPVMVCSQGGDADKCATLFAVSGLSRDGFLAVKAGPGTHYARIDKLSEGKEVWVYDAKVVGKDTWFGIVYIKNAADLESCNVYKPINKPYKGACQSGWVSGRWLKQIAG